MFTDLNRKFPGILVYIFIIVMLVLINCNSVFAHDGDIIGTSTWEINRDSIDIEFNLNSILIEYLDEAKVKNYIIENLSDKEVKEFTNDYLEDYFNEKYIIYINGEKLNLDLEYVGREEFIIKFIGHIENVQFKNDKNTLKIDYEMFFTELDRGVDTHIHIVVVNSKELGFENSFTYQFDIARNQCEFEFSHEGFQRNFFLNILNFIVLGIEHILLGYDHILFLISLIVIRLRVKEALKILTSFTVAHSITILFAALGVIKINSIFVESVIALSICYVSMENILKKDIKFRWIVTFIFGLIHGFGFASVLQGFIGGSGELISSIVAFNIGIEIGQFAIFAVIAVILFFLDKKVDLKYMPKVVSIILFIIGFIWLVQRAVLPFI